MAQLERTRGSDSADGSVGSGGSRHEEATTSESRARRVGFRVVAALAFLWVLAMMVFGLTEVVLMWLPGDTLLSMGDELELGPDDLVHRAHFMSIGTIAWGLMLGVAVQLRRPARREAPMLHALVLAVGGAIVHGLSGSAGEWLLEELTVLAPLVLLALLHPRARQLVRVPAWDPSMRTLAAVAAVPWLVFAVTQAHHQWRNVAGDTHAEMEHWGSVALMALLVVACAVIGATRHSGWRLTAWIAVAASVNFGLHSLAFPHPASAAPTPWAIAATVWGVVYAAAIIRRGHVELPTPAVG